MSTRFYVTTPIYYVNDAPHIGHAYTTVAADAIARWRRLKGHRVHFLTGTDEHGRKVLLAADKRGVSPQAHVDELHLRFKSVWARLDITHDDFIRTTEPRHKAAVQAALQRLHDQGDLYEAAYAGWYSVVAERYWTEKDLVDGKCPETGGPVEWVEEHNWFFRMSRYADRLRAWVEEHPDWVRPESRRNELLGALRKEVPDLCISRPKARLSWGIELPFAPDYVTYVWVDALLNYVSAIGWPQDPAQVGAWWPADLQLLGKDILTTHTVYWGTLLFALGLEPARTLYAHGWWTVEGQKMSKSLGNVVDPNLLVDAYGPDPVRYVLLAEKSFGADGDFSHRGFQLRYNAELANDLGNLAHRGLSMTCNWLGGQVPPLDADSDVDRELAQASADAVARFDAALEGLLFKEATEALVALATAGNKYIDTLAPWALNKAGDRARLGGVMRRVLEVCRVAATLLSPLCPGKAAELLRRVGAPAPRVDGALARLDQLPEGAAVTLGDPLFPRMLELPPAILSALQAVEATEAPRSLQTGAARPAAKAPAKEEARPAKEPAKEEAKPSEPSPIAYEDFARVQLRAGQVLSAQRHPNADRLLVLTVDIGEAAPRTIVAGIADRYRPEELAGLQVVVVANLKPAKLRGVTSHGMLLAAGAGSVEAMVTTLAPVAPGTVVR